VSDGVGDPVVVTVKLPAVPTVNVVPFELVIAGAVDAGLMVNVTAFEVPPPAGFVTVTFTVPAVTMSAAGIVATIWTLLTEEGVIAGLDPKFTVAPVANPVPLIVNGKLAPPATALDGLIDEMLGAGFAPSNPYTSTSLDVPTYTFPLTTVGTANFTAFPAASRAVFCALL
jgi:hypothetical protein